jgi:predicted RNase H-like nuclease
MKLSGIDLAWNSEQNTSAIATGELSGSTLSLMSLHPAVLGLDTVISIIEKENDIVGIAIDAPLIIHNRFGQRECEQRLNQNYRARLASCHPANLSLYPNASSVRLSKALLRRGYRHLNEPDRGRWQIECYPHPAIIEIFGLKERLLYKKGTVEKKRQGQILLAEKIKALANSGVMRLAIAPALGGFLEKDTILSLRGHRLKQNEDTLDSVVCLYVCSLYAKSIEASICYGSPKDGYIYVPQLRCI